MQYLKIVFAILVLLTAICLAVGMIGLFIVMGWAGIMLIFNHIGMMSFVRVAVGTFVLLLADLVLLMLIAPAMEWFNDCL